MNKLFICGCARSGTSALTNLLNRDDRIIIGTERYINIYEKIQPVHFQKDRFLNPNQDEMRNPDNQIFNNFRIKWDKGNVQYIGDKAPRYYKQLYYLTRMFPDCKILFLWRNLYEVASSYNVRARQKKNWGDDRDYRQAVQHWNESLQCVYNHINNGNRDQVHIIKYEAFFSGDQTIFESLYNFLSLEIRPRDIQAFNRITDRWETISSKPLTLDENMYTFLDQHKNGQLESWISKLAHSV